VAEAAALVHRHGGLVHVDAVQAAGRLALDRAALGADTLALSAHKLGGPAGVGALVVAPGLSLAPLLRGGGQERRRRAGTENWLGIVGFGCAAGLAPADLAQAPRLAALRDRLEREARVLAPAVRVLGAGAARVATTSCLAVPGLAAETQMIALDLAGVAVGAGAACSSGSTKPSHVLSAMAVSPDLAGAAIRVSLGWASQDADIDRFLEAWGGLLRQRRQWRGGA
jgi:cysteine desulfurase